LSGALRKHLIWLESLPPRTCEALAAALARLGRVLGARSDPRAGLATNLIFTVARFRAVTLADAPWSPDRSTSSTAYAKPGSRKNERGPPSERQESPISAMQSEAESRKNLARSPIVFVIVQETGYPRLQ
jgi:hypothetical protein